MDPITLALIAAATSAATKAGVGIYQRIKANRMAKNSKGLDGQQVPLEYQRNLKLAERAAMEGLPEQAYQNQLNQINAQQAQAARGLTLRRNTAGQLNNVVANTNRATMGLNAADAQARRANQQGVMSARQIIAQAKQRAYDIEQQSIAAMRGAGLQNITGAADTAMYGTMMAAQGGGGATTTAPTTKTVPTPRVINDYNIDTYTQMSPGYYNNPNIPFAPRYRKQ